VLFVGVMAQSKCIQHLMKTLWAALPETPSHLCCFGACSLVGFLRGCRAAPGWQSISWYLPLPYPCATSRASKPATASGSLGSGKQCLCLLAKQADLIADVTLIWRNTRWKMCEKLKRVLMTFFFSLFFFKAAGHWTRNDQVCRLLCRNWLCRTSVRIPPSQYFVPYFDFKV